jgi:hypothetical protein
VEGPQISIPPSELQFSNTSVHAAQDSDSDSTGSDRSMNLVCSDEELSVGLQMLEDAANVQNKDKGM